MKTFIMGLLLASTFTSAFAQYDCSARVASLEFQNMLLTQALAARNYDYYSSYARFKCSASCMAFSPKADSQGRWKRRISSDGYGGPTAYDAYISARNECKRNVDSWAGKEGLTNIRFQLIGKQAYDDAPGVTNPEAICTSI